MIVNIFNLLLCVIKILSLNIRLFSVTRLYTIISPHLRNNVNDHQLRLVPWMFKLSKQWLVQVASVRSHYQTLNCVIATGNYQATPPSVAAV